MRLARRLAILSAVGGVLGAWMAILILTDAARERVACAGVEPAKFCALGPGLVTLFAQVAVGPFLAIAALAAWLAYRVTRGRPVPRARTGFLAAGGLFLAGALAAAVEPVEFELASAACGEGQWACIEARSPLGEPMLVVGIGLWGLALALAVTSLVLWRSPRRANAAR